MRFPVDGRHRVYWRACGIGLLLACSGWGGQEPPSTKSSQGSLPRNFPLLGWQPTNAPPGAVYAGTTACEKCHMAEASTQPFTPMGKAMEPASNCDVLRTHVRLELRKGRYLYRVVRRGAQAVYIVSDGRQTVREPIVWAFGLGEAGQTYVFRHNGSYIQSRVSFFADVQNLGLTLGVREQEPASLATALGSVISDDEARLCFGCHSTRAVSGPTLQLQDLVPGITCEGCHGPGQQHVDAVTAGYLQDPRIFNPGKLRPEDLIDFCGSCHRSALQVELMNKRGVETVRFQPYRLRESRCYSPDDARVTCLACHDPHGPRERSARFYDARCLACHASLIGQKPSRPSSKPCPVATKECVTCHMPKYPLPGGHFRFTDHRIRVARVQEPYPD